MNRGDRRAEWQRYIAKHREERNRKRRERYALDPSKEREYAVAHKEQIKKRMSGWLKKNKARIVSYSKKSQRRNKQEVINAYGGHCVCCGESEFEFLTVDHVNGNGRRDRKGKAGSAFYAWLRRNKFPKDGYQLLCMNCNFAKGKYGRCPHETVKFEVIGLAC